MQSHIGDMSEEVFACSISVFIVLLPVLQSHIGDMSEEVFACSISVFIFFIVESYRRYE